jgi:hypothetical protein
MKENEEGLMEKIVSLCKRRGFVFQGSEIYGGMAGVYDFGPKGYSPYFLTVADYVDFARRNDIVETTRGSGAGSIVSYALGITTVNPLYFKLPFERFLNPFRPSPPDIDTDFADDRRDEMINYVDVRLESKAFICLKNSACEKKN